MKRKRAIMLDRLRDEEHCEAKVDPIPMRRSSRISKHGVENPEEGTEYWRFPTNGG